MLNNNDLFPSTSKRPKALLRRLVALCAVAFPLACGSAQAADGPSVTQALGLKPLQQGIEYDQPTAEQQATCKVEPASEIGQRGWIVRDEAGKLLRRFVDTNSDNKLDQWCYYRDGIEVYRDVDANFNEKADEYRWLGTAGTRWGIDRDEDGKIDSWKRISAEEVTSEIVAAVKEKDFRRFSLVLLKKEDLQTLGVSAPTRTDLEQRLADARAAFDAFVAAQQVVTATSRWEYFGGSRPSLIPAGTDGSTADIVFYDNVTAMVEDGDQHNQIAIGTLVQLESGWRVVDAPEALVSGQAMRQGSVFITQASSSRPVEGTAVPEGMSAEMQAVLLDLGKHEAAMAAATTPQAKSAAFDQYLTTMLALSRLAGTPSEKTDWIRQAADSIYIAMQNGDITNGPARLQQLTQTLTRDNGPADGIAYVEYRIIESNYSAVTAGETDAQYEARQKKWIEDLEAFATKYAASEVSAQALMELAMLDEFAAQPEKALERYRAISTKFPNSELASRAGGAVWRLTAVGQAMELSGTLVTGTAYNGTAYQGKTLVVHCWANWSDPQGTEINAIRAAQTKFASKGLQCVGVIADLGLEEAAALVRTQRINWPQVADQDGALAARFGLVTLPVIFIVNAEGKVVKVLDSAATLDDELEALLK